MKFIISYVKEYKGRMSLGLLIKIIGTLMDLILPWMLAYIINDLIPLNELGYILIAGGVMMLCAFIGWSFNVIANRMAGKVARDATYKIRKDLFSKTLSLSQAQTDKITVPSLISRMTSDTYNVNNFIGMVQRLGVRAPILLVFGIIVTLTLDPVLTLIMVACLPAVLLVIILITKFGVPLYKKVQAKIDGLVLIVRENISGMKVIKSLGKEKYEQDRFDDVNVNLSRSETKATLIMNVINPALNLIMNFGLICVVYFGARRVYEGPTEAGTIVAFLSYFTIILNAILSVTRIFINGSKACSSANRIKEIMDLNEDIKKEECNDVCDNYIEFKDVSFSYHKTSNVLSNISFSLKKGESIGIIGATGSGKSTILSLLLRFYDVDSGSVYVDGKNVKSYDLKDLRSKFGVVFQNDYLFSLSILENIDFSRNIDFEEIEAAATKAQAKNFIERVGYSKELSAKGSNLSGGERQRVLLSRALASNPEILMLDDSSSALDYKTDKALREEIFNIPDITLILVASRISSVKDCDKIIVLEEGKILDIGTHEELLSRCKVYQEIKESQMGGDADELQ